MLSTTVSSQKPANVVKRSQLMVGLGLLFLYFAAFSPLCEKKNLARRRRWSDPVKYFGTTLTSVRQNLRLTMVWSISLWYSPPGDSHVHRREIGFWNCELPWIVMPGHDSCVFSSVYVVFFLFCCMLPMHCIYVLCRALAPPQDRHLRPRPLAIKGAPAALSAQCSVHSSSVAVRSDATEGRREGRSERRIRRSPIKSGKKDDQHTPRQSESPPTDLTGWSSSS
ncbi:hypothetical protein Y032_0781g2316 [Ancylostoma ceylanicum]|uniref:Uncharacterized protein n=1 Tax=Ancylostoma ceylanicum TaxID=53326 RepID=A0A016WCN1_9BILA|nr:hypothetical protein Y032_0781g2316 [Ancylostoma ceylanicum]